MVKCFQISLQTQFPHVKNGDNELWGHKYKTYISRSTCHNSHNRLALNTSWLFSILSVFKACMWLSGCTHKQRSVVCYLLSEDIGRVHDFFFFKQVSSHKGPYSQVLQWLCIHVRKYQSSKWSDKENFTWINLWGISQVTRKYLIALRLMQSWRWKEVYISNLDSRKVLPMWKSHN